MLPDINLPGMDGQRVLAHLRTGTKTRNIPVVAISANATPGDIDKGMAAGLDDYLTRPVDIIASSNYGHFRSRTVRKAT